MLSIENKDMNMTVEVYFIRQLPDGSEKSGYFKTTLGNLFKATRKKNNPELISKGFLWLHSVFEYKTQVVAIAWCPPLPWQHRSPWTCSHKLTDWHYEYRH